MCSLRLVALLACIAFTSAVDTEGTNFVFAFVRNANPDISNQKLSAIVLNKNTQAANFTLTYRPDYYKSTPPQDLVTPIPANGYAEISIPPWYGFNYTGDGPQDDVYLTLLASSDLPVTVLASNYDNVTNQGDTYLVLPTTWGSKSFTFSLPPSAVSNQRQYEQVFVLPTEPGNTLVQFNEIGNAQSSLTLNLTYGNVPAVYVGTRTTDTRPRTYHITSDKNVLIIAGVTCAGFASSSCDHVAYMPHPQAASDCYTYDYYDDDHISYIPTTSRFYTDIPGSCSVVQNITATLTDGVSSVMGIKPNMESPLWRIDTTGDNEKGVSFHSGGTNIHIARYYDGTYDLSNGAFISTSPSVTQFHTEPTTFYTRNPNDTVEVYCTILVCTALTIDGSQVHSLAPAPIVQTVDDEKYFIYVFNVAASGFHKFDIDSSKQGVYGYFVFGNNGQFSYGYEGGLNKPKVVLAPVTTPGTGPTQPPTSTPTVPTTPSTSQQSKTTTVASTQTAPVTSTLSSSPIPTTTNSRPISTSSTSSGPIQSTTTTISQTSTFSPSSQITSTPTPVVTTTVPVTSPTVVPVTSNLSSSPVPTTTNSGPISTGSTTLGPTTPTPVVTTTIPITSSTTPVTVPVTTSTTTSTVQTSTVSTAIPTTTTTNTAPNTVVTSTPPPVTVPVVTSTPVPASTTTPAPVTGSTSTPVTVPPSSSTTAPAPSSPPTPAPVPSSTLPPVTVPASTSTPVPVPPVTSTPVPVPPSTSTPAPPPPSSSTTAPPTPPATTPTPSPTPTVPVTTTTVTPTTSSPSTGITFILPMIISFIFVFY